MHGRLGDRLVTAKVITEQSQLGLVNLSAEEASIHITIVAEMADAAGVKTS